jgi:hypothetical protein
MVLKKMALSVLTVIGVCCLLVAIAGPIFTYLIWKDVTYRHQMQSEGIETKARITASKVTFKAGTSKLSSISFDIDWSDKQGHVHKANDVSVSVDYGTKFLSDDYADALLFGHYKIVVTEVPIRYLATDPQQFILSNDPKNSVQGAEEVLQRAEIISAIGMAGLPIHFLMVRSRRRQRAKKAANPGGVTPEQAAADEKSSHKAYWVLASLALYGMVSSIHFNSDGHAMDIKAFGANPFGLPVLLVVMAIGTVLYIPVAWMLWHFTRIAEQARKDGRILTRFYLLYYVFTAGGHSHLRGSRNAVLLGGVYIFGLCAAWITYTAMKHI